jgi:hypothetical protein
MTYLKYLWLIGVIGGGWLIKIAWHDPCEGPYFRFIGLVIAIVCFVKLMEAYRKSIIADIREKDNQPEL